MNRKISGGILVAVVCLAFGFLTGCSSSSTPAPTIGISASGGTGQTQTVNEAFPTSLQATVTSNGAPASGVTVTFAAPSSGASCTPSATTATTDSNGNATITCTANGTAGGYSVTASTSGATSSASFSETNAAPSVFVFYVSGLESIDEGPNYYAIAGAVGFDLSGNVLGGEQDYNDGFGLNSAEPSADTISATGSSMTIDSTTGTGTLVLVTSNTNVGSTATPGTETFAVQFMNASHALITQFDGSATSSGSMDLQTANSMSGNYAFTLTGTDEDYWQVAFGGVFSDASGAITGTFDENDGNTSAITGASTNNAFTATDNGVPSTDAYGRGTISGFTEVVYGQPISLAYYVVGPEVARIIDVDVDSEDALVGSAYGQNCTTCAFDSTALGSADAFGLVGNPWGALFASAGNLVPAGAAAGTAGATFTGEGDDNEEGDVLASGSAIGGSYTIATNGYGNITGISGLGDITMLGIYATDPALNLLDPNNTSGGGGALAINLDQEFSGGTGVIVPQATTLAATDLNNSYGFGAQDYNGAGTLDGWEYDFVGQGSFASLVLTGTGDISDPFASWVDSTPATYTGVAFAGTASGPDAAGRYTYPALEGIGPVGSNTTASGFTAVMYEANSALVFSVDDDSESLWLGTYQMQASTGKAAFMRGKKAGKTVKGMVRVKH